LGEPSPPSRGAAGVLAPAILLLVGTWVALAQSGARPAFGAASIKANAQTNPRGMIIRPQPGGRLTSENAPLAMLIQNAYSVQPFQIVGGPSWVNTAGYDIDAKPEANTDRKQMWLMLQTLLADRFKLALHRETRELPMFALTMTKGGLKQPPAKESNCVEMDLFAAPPPPGSGQPCGRVVVSMSPSGLTMQGSKIPAAELIRVLAMVMGRPIVDRTELAREFEVNLQFTPDENTMGLPGARGPRDPGGPQIPTDTNRPNILSALEDQLGLKLASTKGPVEVLVIDHVERPSAN
jgi:uncharacterized protein (TIGR03435 family)